MQTSDVEEFSKAWKPAHEIYGNDLSDAAIMISFEMLKPYEIIDVKKGLAAHMRESSFAPKPADVIKQIEKANHDGRLPADEAWALALASFDEHRTVVLNDEIAASLTVARDIYSDGDKTGARMAFRAAYEREVDQARKTGKVVHWWPSYGADPTGREAPVREAVEKGRLGISALHQIGITHQPIADNVLEHLKPAIERE